MTFLRHRAALVGFTAAMALLGGPASGQTAGAADPKTNPKTDPRVAELLERAYAAHGETPCDGSVPSRRPPN